MYLTGGIAFLFIVPELLLVMSDYFNLQVKANVMTGAISDDEVMQEENEEEDEIFEVEKVTSM